MRACVHATHEFTCTSFLVCAGGHFDDDVEQVNNKVRMCGFLQMNRHLVIIR